MRSTASRWSTLAIAGTALLVASGVYKTDIGAQGDVLTACVNPNSGEMKMVAGAGGCHNGWLPLEWNQQGATGPQGPPGTPGAAAPPATVSYVRGQMYPGTSVARAICPAGSVVTGGGGSSISGQGLKQNFPIADESGTFAFGNEGIGWQVAATDWSDVEAFAICLHQ